jgi:hypothetical protein
MSRELEIPGTYPVGGAPISTANIRQLRDYVNFTLELARDGKRPSVDDSNIAGTALDMLADSCLALIGRDNVLSRYHAELMDAMTEISRLRELHAKHCCLECCPELEVPGHSTGQPRTTEAL